MSKLELWKPVKPFTVTQVFGVNGEYYQKNGINIKGHNGLDCVATHGQVVRAAHAGTVTFAGEDGGGGYGVVVRTNQPFDYAKQVFESGEPFIKQVYFKTIYWHLIPSIPVKAGASVEIGDVIGYADNTGFSAGDHLHFGLKPIAQGEQDWQWYNLEQNNGYAGAIDPMPYFGGYFAEDVKWVLYTQGKLLELINKVLVLMGLK